MAYIDHFRFEILQSYNGLWAVEIYCAASILNILTLKSKFINYNSIVKILKKKNNLINPNGL